MSPLFEKVKIGKEKTDRGKSRQRKKQADSLNQFFFFPLYCLLTYSINLLPVSLSLEGPIRI